VLYDLLGRYHHDDLREATVSRFMQRYEVDRRQASRVSLLALELFQQLRPQDPLEDSVAAQFLIWAARLHEVGISVAHSSFHKHSAYILANADMPGFSKRDQALLARLVLAHRGKLERVQSLTRQFQESSEWLLIFCLRIAALLHRARDDAPMPRIGAAVGPRGFQLHVDAEWLAEAPLTAAVLTEEVQQWSNVGIELKVRRTRAAARD
jgi:exopolyphosphatase/guanosine-5'-triphosphate,3'-diphosphate pyrophosphatase